MRYGIDLAAQDAEMTGLFAGSNACPPIRQLQRIPELQRCTQMNQSVWAFLQDRSDMQTVILAARWPLSVEGTRYRREAGSPVVFDWAGSPENRPLSLGNAELFEASLTAGVEEILATGRRVVLIGSTPEVGWNVPRALARRKILGEISSLPELSQADFEERGGRAERILSGLAQHYDGVTYIPLSDLFCVNGSCAVTDEAGLPLYQDDDHISRQTAQSVLVDRLSEIWTGRAVQ